MKLLEFTTYYPAYIDDFYRLNPGLENKSFKEQFNRLYQDCFAWADFWNRAMSVRGYQMHKIILNAFSIQKAWAFENDCGQLAESGAWNEIAMRQIKTLQPDIIIYDHSDAFFLKEIKKNVPSVRLIMCWAGSAIPESAVWGDADIILSCAPETVEYFKNKGHENVFHLNHAFDPSVNERLNDGEKKYKLIFIGQLLRMKDFHTKRELMLERLASNLDFDIDIFSPNVDCISFYGDLEFVLRKYSYKLAKFFKKIGFSEEFLSRIPKLGRAALWKEPPVESFSPILRRYVHPGVFGLQMYQTIKDSLITLNIHADSSPRFASNMRLFEVTGVGCCLLTDWRPNIKELFEPDYEIVTYESIDECVEKSEWLLNNPEDLKKISLAGMLRCKKDHSFNERSKTLDAYIKEVMNRSKF